MIQFAENIFGSCYAAGKIFTSSTLGQLAFTRYRVSGITSVIADSLYTKIYDFKCRENFTPKVCRLLKVPCFETCAKRIFHISNETFGVIDPVIESAQELGMKWAVSESKLTKSHAALDFFKTNICFDACKASYQPMSRLSYDEAIAGSITIELALAQFTESAFETIAERALSRLCDKETAYILAQISGLAVGLLTFYQIAPAGLALSLVDVVFSYGAVNVVNIGFLLTEKKIIELFLYLLKK